MCQSLVTTAYMPLFHVTLLLFYAAMILIADFIYSNNVVVRISIAAIIAVIKMNNLSRGFSS